MKNKNNKRDNRKDSDSVYDGTLDITRSGMGYVVVENLDKDILVRPNDFNTALHGDKVKVQVHESAGGSKNGRLQGEVVEVVARKQVDFLGKLDVSSNFAFFIADTDKPMPDVFVPLDKLNGATALDKVLVRIVTWEKKKKPRGEVIQIVDATNLNDMAMKELIMLNGFPVGFDKEVLDESEQLPDVIPPEEIAKRKDVREVLTFTIDPVDAKDFDDAVSIAFLPNGNYEIGIHIADVGHYVVPDSLLDKSAYERATSVYLPDRVNPMLPERISNELCSLRPHEDKCTFSVIVEITKNASVKNVWIGKTVIHSDHRFSYEEVQEIIENSDGLYANEVLIFNQLAQRMRKQRFKKGAINFSSAEVKFKLDAQGKPVGIMMKESKESHQLIEEFMLLANRLVAERVAKTKINKQPIPFPYRVHDTPDEEKLMPFAEFAKKYGHKFDTKSPEGIAASFNLMLSEVKGKPEQHVLEQLGIRTMAKAVYTAENIGHYGLGFTNYTHFTSPIRRYPDVMVHRVLEQVLNNTVVPDKDMDVKCKHCSDRERAAMETERAGNKYKQVEYMQNYLGDEFEGVISGVSTFGFWVETVEHKCEGLVSLNSLSDYDNFEYVSSDYCLAGKRSGRIFRMGDKIRIKVISANLTRRQLDYEWVLTSTMAGEPKREHIHSSNPVPQKRNKQSSRPHDRRNNQRGKGPKKKSGSKPQPGSGNKDS